MEDRIERDVVIDAPVERGPAPRASCPSPASSAISRSVPARNSHCRRKRRATGMPPPLGRRCRPMGRAELRAGQRRGVEEGIVIVVEGEGTRIGLFVDELIGQQQAINGTKLTTDDVELRLGSSV